MEAGDILIPVSEGTYDWSQIKGELGDLVMGKIQGRSSTEDMTIFNSIGNAVQDLVIASNLMGKK